MKRQEERIKVPCLNRKRMWHKTLVEEEVNIGVLRRETSPKLGQSLDGKLGRFQKNCRLLKKDKGNAQDTSEGFFFKISNKVSYKTVVKGMLV